jgi:prenyltransferase beta subunit
MKRLNGKMREELIKFIFSMENPSGGFNYPRDTPASIEETYYAIEILCRLEAEYTNMRTKRYVLRIDLGADTYLKHLYQLTRICDYLGLSEKDAEIQATFLGRKRTARLLSDLPYHILLSKRYGRKVTPTKQWTELIMKKLDQKKVALSTCCKCVLIGEELAIELPVNRLLDWIKKSQNYDGGFGFYPGTTSFLENVWYAVSSLHILGSKPNDVDECERFILRCASNNGGFGRQMRALPTLEYSMMAVEGLIILDAMRSQNEGNLGEMR